MKTWNERIAEALILTPPRFSENDHNAASSWCSCKWGEMAVRRKQAGLKFAHGLSAVPRDFRMERLGNKFTYAVMTDRVYLASKVSEEMEARALELAESAAAHDAVSVAPVS